MRSLSLSAYGKRSHKRHVPTLYFYNWRLVEVQGRWFCTKELKAWRGGKVEHLTKREAEAECQTRNARVEQAAS